LLNQLKLERGWAIHFTTYISRHCDQVICLNRSLMQGPPAVALLPETQ